MPELHVTRWGDSGSTVVMIHGGAQGSSVGGDRCFAAQQRLAERGWQVVVPDRPGHGKSPDPVDPTTRRRTANGPRLSWEMAPTSSDIHSGGASRSMPRPGDPRL